MRRFEFIVIAAIVFAAGPASAASEPGRRPPNVLLLLTDDQRPDTIGALGNPAIRTPHLDAMVRGGTALTRATCANPICTPSRAEIMTGATGFKNGILDFGRKVNPDCTLWAETMRRAGYRTWYVGKWHNSGRPADWGYEESNGLFAGGGGRWAVPSYDWNGREVTGYRGWVFQTDDRQLQPEKGIGLSPNISEHFADAAVELIERKPQKPFFLHVNFAAPHDPLLMPLGYERMYDPDKLPLPANFQPRHPFDHGNFDGRDERLFEWPRTREMVRDELAVYYAVVSHLDAQIGRILEALDATGQRENTLIIFASDHGLAIGSHGLRGKQNMYEHTIGVPLIFSGPGVPQDKRSAAQCYLRDLFPTVCDVAGIETPSSVEGRSLLPVLTGEKDSIYPEVYGYFRDVQRMVRTDRWKLIRYPKIGRDQLFDLKADPHELKDLAADPRHGETLSELRSRLESWQRRVSDPAARSTSNAPR